MDTGSIVISMCLFGGSQLEQAHEYVYASLLIFVRASTDGLLLPERKAIE
jgi:hypothetical protein